MKICHVSSAHNRNDARIYYKEILSLKKAGHTVCLIIADGFGNDTQKSIFDVGKPQNRMDRVFRVQNKITKQAKKIDADIYHIHDPELLRFALRMKSLNKIVIYDIHEDLPRQILTKKYIIFKRIFSGLFEYWENKKAKGIDYLITATDHIKKRFSKINPNTISIKNYPISDELQEVNKKNKSLNSICYIGGLSQARGTQEIIEVCYDLQVPLNIAGRFLDKDFKRKISLSNAWKHANYHGFVQRDEIKNILEKSYLGVVTLYPMESYIHALPVKMFEYMSAGLPVIASNFPEWKHIIEKNNCGVCVDPCNLNEIKEAIKYLIDHPNEAAQMGENGRKAVLNKYNWSIEEQKLLSVYKKIINDHE